MRHYYYTSKKNGVDITCDRCGNTEFLDRLRNHEVIGGKLRSEIYSAPKFGWIFGKDQDLCPGCSVKEHIQN